MTSLTILPETDYYTEICAAAQRARRGDRLGAATMNFDPIEPVIKTFALELTAAAKRGVNVRLQVDAMAFMMDHQDQPTGPLLRGGGLGLNARPEFRDKYQLLTALEQAGGHFAIVNKPLSRITLPVAGRSHLKCFIHNNQVYIGGCNLGHVTQQDWMVGFKDKQAADWLYELLGTAGQTGSVRRALRDTDRELRLDTDTTLLVDAGRRRQSLILQSALRLIDEAQEHLLITCQFFPNAVTASHLARAHKRGVHVEVFYNHASHQPKLFGMIQQAVLLGERLRLPATLFNNQLPAAHPRLHAKILASEKAAMIGSHNYVSLGVNLGTAEVALLRRDAVFAEALVATIRPALQSVDVLTR